MEQKHRLRMEPISLPSLMEQLGHNQPQNVIASRRRLSEVDTIQALMEDIEQLHVRPTLHNARPTLNMDVDAQNLRRARPTRPQRPQRPPNSSQRTRPPRPKRNSKSKLKGQKRSSLSACQSRKSRKVKRRQSTTPGLSRKKGRTKKAHSLLVCTNSAKTQRAHSAKYHEQCDLDIIDLAKLKESAGKTMGSTNSGSSKRRKSVRMGKAKKRRSASKQKARRVRDGLDVDAEMDLAMARARKQSRMAIAMSTETEMDLAMAMDCQLFAHAMAHNHIHTQPLLTPPSLNSLTPLSKEYSKDSLQMPRSPVTPITPPFVHSLALSDLERKPFLSPPPPPGPGNSSSSIHGMFVKR